MTEWPPLQEVNMTGFWRQWTRKELVPWQADACRRPPPPAKPLSPPPRTSIYDRIYDTYSSKSAPPARPKPSVGAWSPTAAPRP